ncbi:MAG: penicillin-binding protein 2 [Flavobacteriales bacterium]|nr:penicillin-binding protein 2 [Flavobacteriales bacterium]MCB9167369.1 penicillin-binding protein 2 [Flavobacteriales bacterium]
MNFEERKYVLIAAVVFIASVFVLRLFWVQVVDDRWKAEAANISERKVTVYPARGLVLDRRGELLVANTPVYDIMVVPREVRPFDTTAFARLVGVPLTEVRRRLSEANAYSSYKPSVFEKQIPSDQYATIAVHLFKYAGFYGQSRTLRTYPQRIAAHLLGYLSEVDARKVKEDPYYKPGDVIGVGGLESYYEKALRGKRGVNYVVVDVHNKVQGPYKDGQYDTLAFAGKDLYTSIDARMQAYGERLMRNKKGSIVAIEPRTGEILCLISSPTYDPELLVGRVRNTNYVQLQRDSLKPLFDRALQAQYPPGSIFKIAQALVALKDSVISPNTGFQCNKALVGCHNHPNAQDVQHAIQYSCNPYFYMVFKRIMEQGDERNRFTAAALNLEDWRKDIMSFGFGQRPNVDLPGAKGGNIPSAAYYDRIYGNGSWAFSTIYSLSIGQGEVMAVPMQMADMACIIANKGWYVDPHVVRAIGRPDSLVHAALERHYTVAPEPYFELVQEAMRRVVEEPGGTARLARIPGISVCGKTGTAENPHGKDHAVFVSFAPLEDPRIAIAVYVENSGFGGTWAAPIASLLMEQYLTDSISRPDLEKRMLESDLIAEEHLYRKPPKRPRR